MSDLDQVYLQITGIIKEKNRQCVLVPCIGPYMVGQIDADPTPLFMEIEKVPDA